MTEVEGMDSTLKRLAAFMASRGDSTTKSGSKAKKIKLSDSQVKIALMTYQNLELSNSANVIASSLNNLADAIRKNRTSQG